MPSALYAISYKPTRSVVALCSFEQKDLADPAARDQLVTSLVGTGLPISVGGGSPIEIDASQLACDRVGNLSPLELEPVLADPYAFRVSVEPAGAPVVPGDGKEKLLKPAIRYAVSKIELTSDTELQVSVMLNIELITKLTAQLLFEGRDPATVEAEIGTTLLTFRLGAPPPKPDTLYGLVFLMEDTRVEARRVMLGQGNPVKPTPPAVVPAPPMVIG